MTYKPAPQVLARRMPGGAVLVHLDANRIFELNETGARIWEMLHEGVDRDGVLQRLAEEFDVDAERAVREVDRLLGELVREGLLHEADVQR
jgi:hypothetical protein